MNTVVYLDDTLVTDLKVGDKVKCLTLLGWLNVTIDSIDDLRARGHSGRVGVGIKKEDGVWHSSYAFDMDAIIKVKVV